MTSQGAQASADRQSDRDRPKRYALPAVVVCFGVAVSVAASDHVRGHYTAQARGALAEVTERYALSVARSIDRYLEVVQSISGLYAASREVDRGEFRAFVKQSLARYPGIQALEWVPRVTRSQRAAFERSARRDGFSDFSITETAGDGQMIPAAKRDVHFPVFFVEPYVGNEPALGFDLASSSVRREALARARDSGKAVATGMIKLVHDRDGQFGFLILSPIYRKGPTPVTVAERREALEGFAQGVFRIASIIERSIKSLSANAQDIELYDIYLYDETGAGIARFVHHYAAAGPGQGAPLSKHQLTENAFAAKTFNVVGRRWSIVVKPRTDLLSGEGKIASWATPLVGLTLTLLLANHLFQSRNRAWLIERTVAQRTSELSAANGALQDEIANRRQVEKALKRSESRLRDSIDSLNDGFALFDSEERLVLFNKKYRVFNATIADLLAPRVTFNELTAAGLARNQWPEAEEDTKAWLESQMQARRTRGASLERKLDDGRWLLVRLNKTSEGGLVDVRTEITELKEREEELQLRETELLLHRDHLESLVAERTHEVQEQAEQLKEALNKEKEFNALQREFVLMASHEFRTPLAIIDSTAQRITRRSDKLDSEDLTRRMAKIRSAVTRMTTLIDSTLSASRLEGEKIDLQPKSVDLRQLIAEVCQHQREIAKSHEIICDLDELPDTILGDPALLYRVFTNLLSNAIKYSPNDPRVEVGGARDGDDVVVFVRDHGVGIPDTELAKIFGRFFRAATSSGIPGTGIGLNLVKRLVEMHQGTISVDSVEGQGSTFTVRLPLNLDKHASANGSEMPPAAVAGEISAVREQRNG